MSLPPDSSVYIYELNKSSLEAQSISPELQTRLVIGKKGHSAGCVVWGDRDMIYASSESQDKGCHVGYNISHSSKPMVRFNVTDSGDALTLDPDSTFLCEYIDFSSRAYS